MGFEADSELEPLTPEQETRLQQVALAVAPEALSELEAAETEQDRFYALPKAALAAYHLERYDLAAELAASALEIAPRFENDWNFGNAIHSGHTVLGLLAARADDMTRAAEELLKSGSTKGSPQLTSFGPSMQLAKLLLRRGHSEPVLDYLQRCRTFWSMGTVWLDIWEAKIKAGAIPNFPMHSYR